MKKYLLAVLTLLSVGSLHSQTTLEECQRWTEENYPLLKNSDLLDKSTEFSVKNAYSGWLPQIAFSAKATYQSDVTAFPEEMSNLLSTVGVEMNALPKDQYKIALDVQQPIFDGGLTKAKVDMALSENAIQQQQIHVDAYAVKERVNDLYFGILLLQEQARQNELLQELLESNIKRVQGAIEAGTAMQSDRQMLEAELLQVNQNSAKIDGSLKAYRSMLEVFTNHAIDSLILPQPVEQHLEPQNKRPELLLIDYRQQNIAAQTKLLTTSVKPRLNLFAQGFYGNPGLNLFADMTEDKWTLNGIVGLQLQWNISGFYTLKSDKNKMALASGQLEVQREMLLFNLNLKSAEQKNAIARMENVMQQDAEIIALRKTIREAYEAKLDNGVINVNDLLTKITDENKAKIDSILHKIELLKYLYDLKLTYND